MATKESKDPRLCFVVGPIGSEGSAVRIAADWLLNGIVKPVLQEFGFSVRRADEIPEPGMIDSQVINMVIDADLVIADLSGHNPNAFYELAIRHMVEKPIIHMIDIDTEIPFDVRAFRAIVFSTKEFDSIEKAKSELTRQIRQIIDSKHKIDNPVTRARGKLNLSQNATPKEKLLFDTVENVSRRLDHIEKSMGQPLQNRQKIGSHIMMSDTIFVTTGNIVKTEGLLAGLLRIHGIESAKLGRLGEEIIEINFESESIPFNKKRRFFMDVLDSKDVLSIDDMPF